MKFRLLLASVLMTVSVFGQNVPSYVPTNGLVGWWPFNGNANDESGNGNNGTVNGATLTVDRNSNNDAAYFFTGTGCSTRIDAVVNTSTINSNNEFSISFWVKKSGLGCMSQPRIMEFYTPNNVGAFQVNWDVAGPDVLSIETGNNNSLIQSISYLSPDWLNTWHNLVIVCNQDSLKLYDNGLFSAGTAFTGLPRLTSNVSFGRMNHPAFNTFQGSLDDIGIWNRAITQQEITNLYNASLPNTSIPIFNCPGAFMSPQLANGLVGWWPFCGDADDESGNGNDGTVNGATLTSDRFGNVNSAYSFNGINNWIDVANNPTINFQDEFSISVWVKSNQNNYNAGIIGRWNDFDGTVQDGQEEFALGVDDNVQNAVFASIRTNTSPNTNYQIQYNNSSYNDNQWNLFIFCFSNNDISLFKNGVFIGNTLTSGTINNYMQNLEIGRYAGGQPTGGNTHFNGLLDDIGIWNRALDSSEVAQLYNTGLCTQTIAGSCDTLIFNANITGFNPVTYANQVKVYPNPAADNLVIDCGTNYAGLNGYSIRITNLLGQTVYNSPVTAQITNIQLTPPTWVNGTYVVQFVHPNGTVMETKRIIIQ